MRQKKLDLLRDKLKELEYKHKMLTNKLAEAKAKPRRVEDLQKLRKKLDSLSQVLEILPKYIKKEDSQ